MKPVPHWLRKIRYPPPGNAWDALKPTKSIECPSNTWLAGTAFIIVTPAMVCVGSVAALGHRRPPATARPALHCTRIDCNWIGDSPVVTFHGLMKFALKRG